MSKIRTLLVRASVVAVALSAVTPVMAQGQATTDNSAQEADGGVGDIVVTAQFRSQRLQDTPIAITAMDSAMMESRSYNTVTDLTNSAPNVVLKPTTSAFGPGAAIYVRGVGQADTNFAYEPGVGLYVDDVYHGTVFGSQLDLLDLERVEILRGPQGTLAGKNSIGGAVKLFTKKPSGEGGFIEATTGSFDRLDLRGAGDFALVPDRLFVRVSGATRSKKGYLDRLDFGCVYPNNGVFTASAAVGKDCVIGQEGGTKYTAGRVALRWIASDDIEVNVAASRLVDDSEPSATKLLAITVAPTLTPGIANRNVFITGPESYTNYANYTTPAFTDAGGSHSTVVWQPNTRLRTWEVSGSIDWKLGPDLALKSITSYQSISGRYGTDFDTTPYGINTNNITNTHHQFTQELRLNGTSISGLLDWTLGGYYYKATSYIEGGSIIAPGAATSSVFYSDDTIPARSVSGFAHVTAHLTDRLNLTGGIRYTDDKKDYNFRRFNPFNTSQVSYTAQRLIDGAVGSYSGKRWDYRANIDYRLTDDLMVFAQYSTGFRGGGVNPRPFVIQQVVPFNPESLEAYEVGFKSDLLNRAVRLNASAFINNYKDIIFSNTAPTVENGVVLTPQNATPTNAGDARFKGFEAELTVNPLRGLSFDGSVSYLDFQLTKLGAAGATIAGITLNSIAPFVTEWKVSAGAQYEILVGNAGTLTPRLDLAYQSSFYTNSDNNPASLVPAYTMLNGRLTWQSADEDWKVSLAVTNLTDKFYYQNKTRLPIGLVIGTPGAPREWSLTVRRAF
ncbi:MULTISPECIES: TonB-dependent receptor [Sphingobium]|uniref:TonB-dependent receptor n=1 Tax=Sphingobium TaxID=165695 RepID=UPI0015EC1215|nr:MULTISPECIES: TonB-dependent receptor [Sphingobium]MCW2361757.1 iron complex outermembrane receptor protein [Sphingobium sp. B10D3B]MCW2401564.1 iron complex outermembrane receptor protein [Sphingobium sp. B10D7B]MCW2408544.1 iron complex outermembrane receptor protein [Sphingobium xanthum]